MLCLIDRNIDPAQRLVAIVAVLLSAVIFTLSVINFFGKKNVLLFLDFIYRTIIVFRYDVVRRYVGYTRRLCARSLS